MDHLDANNILVKFQHGFRSKHSCETQLFSCVEDLSRHLDNREQLDLIILDFSKVFDKVDHIRLISKLEHYGVKGKLNRWIENWQAK